MSKEKLHRGDIWKYYDNITQQDRKFFILTVYEHHCDVIAENYFSSTEDDKYLKFPLWFDEFEGLNPTFVGKSIIDIEKIFNTKEHNFKGEKWCIYHVVYYIYLLDLFVQL